MNTSSAYSTTYTDSVITIDSVQYAIASTSSFNADSFLYRLQLDGVAVFLVRGALITRGADDETLQQIKENEAQIIRYIESVTSQYWILSTIENPALPLRFKEPVTLEQIRQLSFKVLSAMPCEYEAGLFDIYASEVFG